MYNSFLNMNLSFCKSSSSILFSLFSKDLVSSFSFFSERFLIIKNLVINLLLKTYAIKSKRNISHKTKLADLLEFLFFRIKNLNLQYVHFVRVSNLHKLFSTQKLFPYQSHSNEHYLYLQLKT